MATTTTHAAGGRAARTSTAAGSRRATGQAHAHVASHTPGRVRLRVHHPHRHPELLNSVREQLEKTPGVDQVEVNPHSGSVLVHYDHHASSMNDILGALGDVGMIMGTVAGADELPGDDASDEAAGHSTTAAGFVGTINDLDQRLSRVTGRKVDLKLLFPLALGALGVQSAGPERDRLQRGACLHLDLVRLRLILEVPQRTRCPHLDERRHAAIHRRTGRGARWNDCSTGASPVARSRVARPPAAGRPGDCRPGTEREANTR